MEIGVMDLRLMRSAFKLLFNVSDEVVDTPEIQEWMTNAPVDIIEYDGYLDGEDKTLRDYRMQMTEVYDGDITALSDYLKEINESLNELPKWAIIFKIYNGIKSSESLISQAEKYCATNAKKDDEDRARQIGELSKSSSMVQQEVVEPAPTLEEFLESAPLADLPNEDQSKESDVIKTSEPEPLTVLTEALGKAEVQAEEPFTNNNNNFMNPKEEKEMADVNTNAQGTTAAEDIIPGANFDAAMGQLSANPNFEEQNVAGAKPGAVTTDTTVAKEVLQSSMEERIAFVKQNVVTALVCASEPSVMRLVKADKPNGRVFKDSLLEGENADRKVYEAIDKLIGSFEKATGCKFDAVTEEMQDSEAFPYCVSTADAMAARAIYNLLKTIKGTPKTRVGIYKNAPSFTAKGYVVGGTQYLNDMDMKNLLLAKTTGGLYGQGSLSPDGAPVADAVSFVLGIVKPRTGNDKKGGKVTGNKETTGYSHQIRPVRKVDFLKDAAHRIIVKNTSAADTTFARFKALITVKDLSGGNKEVPATFKYNEHIDGVQQFKTVEDAVATGDTATAARKPIVKTYTLSVYGQVKSVSEEINSALIGVNDKLKTADEVKAYFGVTTSKGRTAVAPIDLTAEISEGLATTLTMMENGTMADTSASEDVKALIAQVKNKTTEANQKAIAAQTEGMN